MCGDRINMEGQLLYVSTKAGLLFSPIQMSTAAAVLRSEICSTQISENGGIIVIYNMKTSGKRIRELRESRNETQEVLSEKLNISLSMLKKIESGRKGVSVDLLVVFAEYFDTSLDFVVLGRNNTATNLRSKIKILIAYMEELEKEI